MNRLLSLSFLLFLSISLQAQNSLKAKHQIEFSIIPTIIYNYLQIGYSLQYKSKHEHAINASISLKPFSFSRANLSLLYSYNYYTRNNKFYYTPLWTRVSNTLNNVSYEEGYFPHSLRYTIGFGLGGKYPIGKRILLRSELGLGTSLNLTYGPYNGSYKSDSFTLYNPKDYSIDTNYPDQNPPFLPAFRFNVRFSILLGKIQ